MERKELIKNFNDGKWHCLSDIDYQYYNVDIENQWVKIFQNPVNKKYTPVFCCFVANALYTVNAGPYSDYSYSGSCEANNIDDVKNYVDNLYNEKIHNTNKLFK